MSLVEILRQRSTHDVLTKANEADIVNEVIHEDSKEEENSFQVRDDADADENHWGSSTAGVQEFVDRISSGGVEGSEQTIRSLISGKQVIKE